MNCSTPGLPVNNLLLESTQTHVHWVGDVIQLSHPLSSPSSSALSLSQHQGLFQWVSSLHQGAISIGASTSASVLPMSIQQWFPLGLSGLISLLSKGPSRVFSSTAVQKINYLALSLLYGPTFVSVHDYWKNHSFDYTKLCQKSDVTLFQYTV